MKINSFPHFNHGAREGGNYDLIPGRALVYTRRLVKNVYHEAAKHAFTEGAIGCSDWGYGFDDISLMKPFYELLKAQPSGLLQKDTERDIVARCKVLNKLPYSKAALMVNAMYLVMREIFAQTKPVAVLSVMIDSYVVDLLHRVAAEYHVPSFGFCLSSYPNHSLIALRGEFNKLREPSDQEVSNFLAQLLDENHVITYNVKYGSYTIKDHLRNSSISWAKALYFSMSRCVTQDWLNFRYLSMLPTKEVGFFVPWNFAPKLVHMDWEDKIERASQPVLFIPLSHIPEATTNYWLRDLRYLDYDSFIEKLCSRLVGTYTIAIKEHWYCRGVRSVDFYRRLLMLPNVILIPPEVNSRQVFKRVERVLVGGGTSGLEAALRGKRVATLTKPYYYLEDYFVQVKDYNQALENLPSLIEGFQPPKDLEHMQRKLAHRVLSSTLPGVTEVCPQLDSEENYRVLGRSLAMHYNSSFFDGGCKGQVL